MLAATLSPGDLVICDNLSVHKNAKARAAIEARGAQPRFLPACSPDLNPIEINRAFKRTGGVHALMFAKPKALVRTAAARCADTLCSAIASALDAFKSPRLRAISPPCRLCINLIGNDIRAAPNCGTP